jgi:hypothetical protein
MKCVAVGFALANGVAHSAQIKSTFLNRDPEDHTKEATLDTVQPSHKYDSDFTSDQNGRSSPTTQNWDTQKVQGAAKYADDYTQDDRAMFTVDKAVSSSESSSAVRTAKALFPGASHDGDWYMTQCDKINDQCEEKKERIRRKYAADLAYLKEAWEEDEANLAEKQRTHSAEKKDVVHQKKKVVSEQKDVDAARVEVKEKSHCPPDLADAESQLAALEAKPDKSPADIDKECELKKKILELKACVTELRAAESILAGEKDQHAEESRDLSEENSEESEAAGAVPPQKAKAAEAEEAYKSFKARGVRGINEVEEECQDERDALERQADADIRIVEDEYLKQKRILEAREDKHQGEKADVKAQKGVVSAEAKDVDAAHVKVQENAHCPPELSSAEARLSELEEQSNKTPADVDEECELKKKILKLKACVEELRAAEKVLSKEKVDHKEEKADLRDESSEEAEAAGAVPPQRRKVADLAAQLAAAKAAREPICLAPNERNSSPAPAPEEKAKSGATRAAGAVAAMLVVLVSGVLQA